jgi:hypothetical protein
MVNTAKAPAAPSIRCRQIDDHDLAGLAGLLKRGFGARRTHAFWRNVLARLQARTVPAGMPRYGYLLENDGAPVGVILLIFAPTPGTDALRANVSSWYVEPAYRSYAPLLAAQALKLKHVTYLNVSAVRHTWPILAAQGYERYSNGVFVAVPALQRWRAGDVRLLAAGEAPDAPHDAFERDLLIEHAACGCMSFWCETRERAHPFVLRPRMVRGVVPCAQLIYCRDVADVVRFAAPIGRLVARRGRPFVVVDANGPIGGLAGRYFADTMPKFFRGPVRPRLGDLARTETALFGM